MTGTAAPLISDPAVVIGRKGNVGQVQLEVGGCWPIDTVYYAAVPPSFDPRFLRWHLHALDLIKLDSSTATPSLRRQDLEAQMIVVPPLEEQRRIVAILEDHLSRLDAADTYLDVSERRLVGLREKVIRDALTGRGSGASEEAELEDVGTADDALPHLAAGWSWTRLGEVADVVGGVTKDAKRQSDPSFVEVPYLRVANVQRGYLDLDHVTTIRVAPTKAAALQLKKGDVLLNEGGDRNKLARGWVWDGQIDNCIHQNHVFRARVTDPRLTPEFLSLTTNTFGGPWAERNGKQSVNLASISLRTIRKMPVVVPTAGQAERAVAELREKLAGIERLQEAARAARARAAALRRSLLAAAFSGRLTGSSAAVSMTDETMGGGERASDV